MLFKFEIYKKNERSHIFLIITSRQLIETLTCNINIMIYRYILYMGIGVRTGGPFTKNDKGPNY